MNVAVLSGLNATTPPATTEQKEEGFFSKAGAWMKANPVKAGLAIGSVVLLIFLLWWFNRKPKKNKRTSGLSGTKALGRKPRSNRRSKRRKSSRKKKVNGLNLLGLPKGIDSSNAYVLCYDKQRIKPSCSAKVTARKPKSTTKKAKR